MEISYYQKFKRSYKRLPAEIKLKAEIKETIFRKDPFDPRLDTHKLHGQLKRQWSFSIDGKYRVLFVFDNSDVIFIDIGDHDLYR